MPLEIFQTLHIVCDTIIVIVSLQFPDRRLHYFPCGQRSVGHQPFLICNNFGSEALTDGFPFHPISMSMSRSGVVMRKSQKIKRACSFTSGLGL